MHIITKFTRNRFSGMHIRRSAVKKRSSQNKCIERLPYFMLLTRNKVVFSLLIILVGIKTQARKSNFGAHIVYTPIVKELTVHQNIRLKTSASFETQTFQVCGSLLENFCLT